MFSDQQTRLVEGLSTFPTEACARLLQFKRLEPFVRSDNLGDPGDDFWQLNVYAGWRFFRNQCEVQLRRAESSGHRL
jgi:hypothetical protein